MLGVKKIISKLKALFKPSTKNAVDKAKGKGNATTTQDDNLKDTKDNGGGGGGSTPVDKNPDLNSSMRKRMSRSMSKRVSSFGAMLNIPSMVPRDDSRAAKNAANLRPDVKTDPHMLTLGDFMSEDDKEAEAEAARLKKGEEEHRLRNAPASAASRAALARAQAERDDGTRLTLKDIIQHNSSPEDQAVQADVVEMSLIDIIQRGPPTAASSTAGPSAA